MGVCMQSPGKVSSCVASVWAWGERSVECVRVDELSRRPADPGAECRLALWQLKGKRGHKCFDPRCSDLVRTQTHTLTRHFSLRERRGYKAHKCGIVPFCFHRIRAALSCQPFNGNREIPVGHFVRVSGWKPFNYLLLLWFESRWWSGSKLGQHQS